MFIATSSFSQRFVFKMFSVYINENEEPAFSNSSGLKSVFEKLRFRDGLVRTEGLTVETKLRFQISSAWCGRGINFCKTATKKTRTTTVATETPLQRLVLN